MRKAIVGSVLAACTLLEPRPTAPSALPEALHEYLTEYADLVAGDVDIPASDLPMPSVIFETSFVRTPALQAQHAVARPHARAISECSGIPEAVVLGVISRESQWGFGLDSTGRGDGGYGRGLGQIDVRYHEFARTGQWWDPEANIRETCRILQDSKQTIAANVALPYPQLIVATVAAFNAGPGGVLSIIKANGGLPSRTGPGAYAADVLDRAGWFQTQGWS